MGILGRFPKLLIRSFLSLREQFNSAVLGEEFNSAGLGEEF